MIIQRKREPEVSPYKFFEEYYHSIGIRNPRIIKAEYARRNPKK